MMGKVSKILFLTTPCIELLQSLRGIVHKFPPLGLAYLASFLEKLISELKYMIVLLKMRR